MSLVFKTNKPKALLDAIKKEIDEDKIATWIYDKDGDFTHTPAQWKNKAWLRPTVDEGQLVLKIIKPESVTKLGNAVLGVYYGRFLEMVSNHFENSFTIATLSF